MQDNLESLKIDHYVNLVFRHRWLILIPFCLSLATGIFLAVIMPKIYEATTLIMVEPQRVPTSYVQSIVSEDIEARISTLSQQIMSRTNLEKIINEFRLFRLPEHAKMFMEDKIESIRKRITIRISRTTSGNDTFSISFRGQDPRTTMDITNTLASYFINENLKIREAQASGTNRFLEEELASMRLRLEDLEGTIKNYRKKYMGELPEQLQTNLAILSRLQQQLNEKHKNLRATREMLAATSQHIASMSAIQDEVILFEMDNDQKLEAEDSGELKQLKAELASLKLKYTDNHPDVVRLTKYIADFEAQKKQKSEAQNEEASEIQNDGIELVEFEEASPEASSEKQSETIGSGFQDFQKIQQDEIKKDIRKQEREIAALEKQINEYRRRVEDTPKREQELLSLNRDYNNIKNSYDSLLRRKLEAEIAVNMERKQKGEQFRILDPARLPEKPVSPNVSLLFLLSLAVGLGIGGGTIFLLDFMDSSYRRAEDIESDLGIQVLAAIPAIEGGLSKVKKGFVVTFTVLFSVISCLLLSSFIILAVKGVEPTIELARSLAEAYL